MNNNECGANLAKETLTGDLRDKLLDNMRNLPDVWQKLNEKAQQEQIDRATAQAEDLVNQAVKLIASGGRKTVPAKLEKLTLKDGCKVEMTCSSSRIGELAPVLNNDVLIVTNSDDEFHGQKAPAKADPDQTEMFNKEYQEVDGEGIPDPEQTENETLALPAPEDQNITDVEFEEVDSGNEENTVENEENSEVDTDSVDDEFEAEEQDFAEDEAKPAA